ncbi:MAG TPA: hypothetical protein VHD81_09580, partial [Mycobacteriales bacterium]|nr:hypothetical protein [Mycobacteriales bacterium]
VKKVTIDPTLYIGQDWSVVRPALIGMGLKPKPEYAGGGVAGTVVGLAPTGKVAKGSTVTVVVARTEPKPKPKPKPKPAKATAPKPHPPKPGPAEHAPPGHAKEEPRKR